MDIWLLGAGAIVLVAITLWIVWPARSADPVGASELHKEVLDQPMTETLNASLPPQGDRFEDQYTSATADLSPGGVAAAIEAMQEPAPSGPAYVTPIRPVVTASPAGYSERDSGPRVPARRMGLGVSATLALAGGVSGAWLYARWQRERNKPINRLKRGARDVASRLSERIPDVEALPRGTAPVSGAATALLLAAIVASRALRRDASDTREQTRDRATDLWQASVREARGRGREAAKLGRQAVAQGRTDAAAGRTPAGLGMGGLALAAGAAFAVWRLLRRRQPDRSTWPAGQ